MGYGGTFSAFDMLKFLDSNLSPSCLVGAGEDETMFDASKNAKGKGREKKKNGGEGRGNKRTRGDNYTDVSDSGGAGSHRYSGLGGGSSGGGGPDGSGPPQYAHYTGWGPAVQTASELMWFKVKDVRKAAKAMYLNGFNTTEARLANIKIFFTMNEEAPFTHYVRFPGDSSYVYASNGDWVDKIRQLHTALQYKGTATNMDAMTPAANTRSAARAGVVTAGTTTVDQGPPPDARGLDKYDDALLQFEHAVARMLNEMVTGQNVLTQATFEEEYELQWHQD